MDYLESNPPTAALVMPYIKPSALDEPEEPANVLVAALDSARAGRTFKSENASESNGSAHPAPIGPN
jgi:hypothetical protein